MFRRPALNGPAAQPFAEMVGAGRAHPPRAEKDDGVEMSPSLSPFTAKVPAFTARATRTAKSMAHAVNRGGRRHRRRAAGCGRTTEGPVGETVGEESPRVQSGFYEAIWHAQTSDGFAVLFGVGVYWPTLRSQVSKSLPKGTGWKK